VKKTRIFLAILLILALFTFMGCTNKDVDLNPDSTDNGVVDKDLNNDGVVDNGVDNNTVNNDLDNDGIPNNSDVNDGTITDNSKTQEDAKTE